MNIKIMDLDMNFGSRMGLENTMVLGGSTGNSDHHYRSGTMVFRHENGHKLWLALDIHVTSRTRHISTDSRF